MPTRDAANSSDLLNSRKPSPPRCPCARSGSRSFSLAALRLRRCAPRHNRRGRCIASVLTLVSAPEFEEAFRQCLKDRGYVEGQNLVLEWRRAEGKTERLADLAADM